MKIEPKKLDTLTKDELIEEYNKLSDVCFDIMKEHHKTAEKYAEQVKETALLAMEFQKFKQEMNEIESTFIPTGDAVEEQKNLIEQSEKRLDHLEEIIKNIERKPITEIKVNKEPWLPENPVDLIKVVEEIEKTYPLNKNDNQK